MSMTISRTQASTRAGAAAAPRAAGGKNAPAALTFDKASLTKTDFKGAKGGLNQLTFGSGGKQATVGWDPRSGALTVSQTTTSGRSARPMVRSEMDSLLKAVYGKPEMIGLVRTLETNLGMPTTLPGKNYNFKNLPLEDVQKRPGGLGLNFATQGGPLKVDVDFATGMISAKQEPLGGSIGYATVPRELNATELKSLRDAVRVDPSLFGVINTIETKLAGAPTR